MEAIRISATDLDALRYYRSDEDGDLAKLLRQLRREEPPTEAMEAGTAFHAVLETAGEGDLKSATYGDFRFDFDVDAEISLPTIREMKATRGYRIGDVLVTLVGKVDAINGRTVYDHKLTGRFDPDRYFDSIQWRCYLAVFGADHFRYNIFEKRDVGGAGSRHYVVHGFHQLHLWRYPELETDVERAVGDFVGFARQHLPEKFTPLTPLGEMMATGTWGG